MNAGGSDTDSISFDNGNSSTDSSKNEIEVGRNMSKKEIDNFLKNMEKESLVKEITETEKILLGEENFDIDGCDEENSVCSDSDINHFVLQGSSRRKQKTVGVLVDSHIRVRKDNENIKRFNTGFSNLGLRYDDEKKKYVFNKENSKKYFFKNEIAHISNIINIIGGDIRRSNGLDNIEAFIKILKMTMTSSRATMPINISKIRLPSGTRTEIGNKVNRYCYDRYHYEFEHNVRRLRKLKNFTEVYKSVEVKKEKQVKFKNNDK